jgi:hypothetical protein
LTGAGSFDCVALRFANGNFAQDDSLVLPGTVKRWGGSRVDFQVHDETYFVSLAEDERRWQVFVSTSTGSRSIPVYVDAPEFEPLVMVQEEKHRILN